MWLQPGGIMQKLPRPPLWMKVDLWKAVDKMTTNTIN